MPVCMVILLGLPDCGTFPRVCFTRLLDERPAPKSSTERSSSRRRGFVVSQRRGSAMNFEFSPRVTCNPVLQFATSTNGVSTSIRVDDEPCKLPQRNGRARPTDGFDILLSQMVARMYCLGSYPRVMASTVAWAYSGSLGAIPSVGFRCKIPGQEVRRGKASLKLKAILKLSEQYCALGLTIWPFWCFQIVDLTH